MPKAYILEFLSYLVVGKVGLCGLTSCLYLQRHYHTRSFSCVIFSCFYALSGFMAAYNWNIMWLDPVILLPLILLGLEMLVKEGRCGLYCVALALCIYTNFYLSIMVCIFLVLYFLTLIATEKCSLRILWRFALFSLLPGAWRLCCWCRRPVPFLPRILVTAAFRRRQKPIFPYWRNWQGIV